MPWMLLSSVGRWVKQGGIAALLFGLVLVAPGCGDAPPGVPGPQIQETTGLWRTSLEGYGMTGRTTIDLSGSGTSGHKYVEAVGTYRPEGLDSWDDLLVSQFRWEFRRIRRPGVLRQAFA